MPDRMIGRLLYVTSETLLLTNVILYVTIKSTTEVLRNELHVRFQDKNESWYEDVVSREHTGSVEQETDFRRILLVHVIFHQITVQNEISQGIAMMAYVELRRPFRIPPLSPLPHVKPFRKRLIQCFIPEVR